MKSGIELIAEERQKQIDKHGFTGKHHASHPEWYDKLQLQRAAASLILPDIMEIMSGEKVNVDGVETPEGWNAEWFNNLMHRPRKQRLIITAALIAAELDREIELELLNAS